MLRFRAQSEGLHSAEPAPPGCIAEPPDLSPPRLQSPEGSPPFLRTGCRGQSRFDDLFETAPPPPPSSGGGPPEELAEFSDCIAAEAGQGCTRSSLIGCTQSRVEALFAEERLLDAGASAAAKAQARERGEDDRFYCGRWVGRELYHDGPARWEGHSVTACSCDGRCGPKDGCQCAGCYFTTFPEEAASPFGETFGRHLDEEGSQKVAVVAVTPSSPRPEWGGTEPPEGAPPSLKVGASPLDVGGVARLDIDSHWGTVANFGGSFAVDTFSSHNCGVDRAGSPFLSTPQMSERRPARPEELADAIEDENRPLVEEVQLELAALRRELAGHNSQLLSLVAQRLDALLERHRPEAQRGAPRSPGPGVSAACKPLQALSPMSGGRSCAHMGSCDSLGAAACVRLPGGDLGRPMALRSPVSAHPLSPLSRSSGTSLFDAWEGDAALPPPPRRRMKRAGTTPVRPIRRISVTSEDTQATAQTQKGSMGSRFGKALSRSFTRHWDDLDDVDELKPATSVEPSSRRKSRTMFLDADSKKRELLQNLASVYCVQDHYYKHGVPQWIARSAWFEVLSLVVICVNGLWIGFDVDNNPASSLPRAPMHFQVAESLFCLFFVAEISIRFLAFEFKCDAFRDRNFLFDLLLVCVMVCETWLIYVTQALLPDQDNNFSLNVSGGWTQVLRLLRLSRMARLARLFRAIPELMVLVKGIRAALTPVGWTLGFLVLVIYFFAVMFAVLTKDTRLGERHFSSVPSAMLTLLLDGLLPDSGPIVKAMFEEHSGYAVLFLFYIVVGTIMVMNMLIGMLVEVVNFIALMEKEEHHIGHLRNELFAVMGALDSNGCGLLTKEEVEALLLHPAASRVIFNAGVDVSAFMDIAEFSLFGSKERVSFSDVIEGIVNLRGTNHVCVRDLVFLQKFIAEEICRLEDVVRHVRGSTGGAALIAATQTPAKDETWSQRQQLSSPKRASACAGIG